MADKRSHKQPVSVLVVIHSPARSTTSCSFERAAHPATGNPSPAAAKVTKR